MNGDTVVRWRTLSEGDARGFNVYRGQKDRQRRVNRVRIKEKGGFGRGAPYSFRDHGAPSSSGRYWLESVTNEGTRRWLGQVTVRR
jgi:hypothetical protein